LVLVLLKLAFELNLRSRKKNTGFAKAWTERMEVSEKSRLEVALEKGLMPGGNLSQELAALGDLPIESVRDAEAICRALQTLSDSLIPAAAQSGAEDCDGGDCSSNTPLHPLASLFQDAETDEAFVVLKSKGLPILLEIFDKRLPYAFADESEDLIFLLKIFVTYGYEPGMQRIVAALRQPLDHNLFVWGVLFETVHDEHPDRKFICDQLRDPLPTGFAGISYLDMVNNMSERGEAQPHPFDTPQGIELLRHWASSDSAEESSYSQSVAHSIPFLTRPERSELLEILNEHDDRLVQVDAAYAAAKLGDAEALKKLTALSEDASVSYFACQYLRQLQRDDLISETARNPHFQAVAEMCAWLSQPDAYGEIPDEIEIFDYRTAAWAPTNDIRPIWLMKFTYAADPNDPEDYTETGIGMVGSETDVLFDDTNPNQSPEEIYALHCCSELQQNGDDRAPDFPTAEAGLKILGW
jgi:hypothetical protein